MLQRILIAARSPRAESTAVHGAFLPLTAGDLHGVPERVFAPLAPDILPRDDRDLVR